MIKPSLRNFSESVSNFIQKTYDILEDTSNAAIICWSWKACSFIIKDVRLFQTLILPKYFKHSNFSSFVRQLNMYNFHKIRGEKQENQFQHPKFKKGYRQLLCKIKRKQNDLPLLTENLNKQVLLNQSQLSQDQGIEENNDIKNQKHGKLVSQSESNTQTVDKLKNQNKILKKTKAAKQIQLKYYNSQNLGFTSQKFYKFIASLLALKIKNQSSKQISRNKSEQSSEIDKQPSNFDEILQHIVGIDEPLPFYNYQIWAKKLLEKHNDQFFMLKKITKAIE